jgi:hypothetical protein
MMQQRKNIRMLVTVAVGESEYGAHGVYTVPAALADELVREKAARYSKPPLARRRTISAKAGRRESWRETVRPGDAFVWQITVKLPRLERPHILTKYELRPPIPSGRWPHRLREVGGDGPRVLPTQAKAIDYLVKHEARLYPKLLRAIAAYAGDFRLDWEARDRRLARRVVPRGMGPREVARRIAFRSIYFPRRSRNGTGYVEFHGGCTWDEEHGFSVVMHRDRVVGVMQQGTGWSDRLPARRHSRGSC